MRRRDDNELESEGIPDLDDAVNEDEGMIPPRDHPQAVEDHGVTVDEQRRGPLLEDWVRREERERAGAGARPDEAGRIVEPDEGAASDAEPEAIAVETDAADLSAEEAAMRVTRDR
jgi:hypothetical protein